MIRLCYILYLISMPVLARPNDFMTSPTTPVEPRMTLHALASTESPGDEIETEHLPQFGVTPHDFATTELGYHGEVSDNCYLDFCFSYPVCGSDCVTYPSHCHLNYAACLKGAPIRIAHEGECSNKTDTIIEDFPPSLSVLSMDSVELTCKTNNKVAIETVKWFEVIDGYNHEINSGSQVLKLDNIVKPRSIYCTIVSCENVIDSNTVVISLEESVCMVHGAGHVLTFNQNHYSHKSECTYLASRDSSDFKWMVYTEFRSSWQIPTPTLTTVTLYYNKVALELRRGWQYNLFGQERHLKTGENEIYGDIVEVGFDGLYLRITAPGLQLIWDGLGTLLIVVPTTTKSSGLCGSNAEYGPDLVQKQTNRHYRSSNLIDESEGDIDEFVRSWAQNPLRCQHQTRSRIHSYINEEPVFNCPLPDLPLTSIKIQKYFQDSCVTESQDSTLILGDIPVRCWYKFGEYLMQDFRGQYTQDQDFVTTGKQCSVSRLRRQYLAYFSDSRNVKPPFLS